MKGTKYSDSQTMIGIEQLHQEVFCNDLKPCWRPYAERTILFSRLKTSPCDAVLGITYDGSILVAIGPSNKYNEGSMNVVLRFYGNPSSKLLSLQHQSLFFHLTLRFDSSFLLLAVKAFQVRMPCNQQCKKGKSWKAFSVQFCVRFPLQGYLQGKGKCLINTL
jgi:hypothetical protein